MDILKRKQFEKTIVELMLQWLQPMSNVALFE